MANKMDPICRLGTRCLKKDEPLEACNSSGCPNFVHPSCFKKAMLAVAEDEWECSVGSDVSTTTRKC